MTVTVVDAGPRRVSRSVEVAAPATELFEMAADPRRHSELDGSGTVRDNIKATRQSDRGFQVLDEYEDAWPAVSHHQQP